MTNIKKILSTNKDNLALVIGNGINRYQSTSNDNSWESLLTKLARMYLTHNPTVPPGIELTEFYDVLELKSRAEVSGERLQEDFCELMETWEAGEHHQRITQWAKKHKAPILTTNFENVLGEAAHCKLHKTASERERFTDFYPWGCYYGNNDLRNPCDGFGIWHVNGMQRYHRSIRLGLTHYMGSVQRARTWIHGIRDESLYSEKNSSEWRGRDTWLHIVFNKPLLFFGLALDENEVFLRWLLIERARYFKKFPDRKKTAWYVHTSEGENSGKFFFLKGVDITPVKAKNYDEIYEHHTWSN